MIKPGVSRGADCEFTYDLPILNIRIIEIDDRKKWRYHPSTV